MDTGSSPFLVLSPRWLVTLVFSSPWESSHSFILMYLQSTSVLHATWTWQPASTDLVQPTCTSYLDLSFANTFVSFVLLTSASPTWKSPTRTQYDFTLQDACMGVLPHTHMCTDTQWRHPRDTPKILKFPKVCLDLDSPLSYSGQFPCLRLPLPESHTPLLSKAQSFTTTPLFWLSPQHTGSNLFPL